MSFGLHKEWKERCVRYSGAKRGSMVLDVCCGSGDLAQLLATKVGPDGHVECAISISKDVNRVTVGRWTRFFGRNAKSCKAKRKKFSFYGQASYPVEFSKIGIHIRIWLCRWIHGDAQQLPFKDNTFDAVTMGYGLRNVTDIPRALSELHRVLLPGHTKYRVSFL